MKAVDLSEILIHAYQVTLHHAPENTVNLDLHQNLLIFHIL